ncbi:hemin uptake protein HemP [Rhodoligotrophos ferricapiens]|uniref:hemin uptake protein HemP n=1 Tax=Rhodoligotrophos ferricapiens TaxID=3069264 RepID=UPI00315DEF58
MTEEKSGQPETIPSLEGHADALGRGRRVIPSDAIFCGQSSALIAHRDEIYTLRVTKQGKLVLNK